jgi:hypothetical protein
MLPIIFLAIGCGDDESGLGDASTPSDSSVGRDGGFTADANTDAGTPIHAAALYPTGRTHSPITPFVAERLQAIAAAGAHRDDVFAKVGDSITVSTGFMSCFDGAAVDLADHSSLEPALEHFRMGDAGGSSPFARTSVAAGGGWRATMVTSGAPSLVEQEIAAVDPAYAIVMFGTNDIGLGDPFGYADSMMDLVDRVLAGGVIPIVSAIPPRDDDPTANALVPLYNTIVRGIAQGRQVPFVDYHRELVSLPMHGLGSDGVHPNQAPGGACTFDAEGARFGYNVRNLTALQALDRVRRVLVEGEPSLDPSAPVLSGSGSSRDPFVIPSLPFADLRNTMDSGSRDFSQYPGCMAEQDESGPEYVYRFSLESATNVHLYVFDRGTADVDLHLLADPDPSSCLARGHLEIERMLEAGEYYVTLDSFVMGETELAGEYLLVIMGG